VNGYVHLIGLLLGKVRGGLEGSVDPPLDARDGIGSGKASGACIEGLLLDL